MSITRFGVPVFALTSYAAASRVRGSEVNQLIGLIVK
jgi:hypothetical protein